MIASVSSALVCLFAAQLLSVVRMECGPQAYFLAPGVLALALGAGLLSRMRLPYLGACFGVVLLSLVRGPLDDLAQQLLGDGVLRAVLSVLLGVAPIGFLLGRQLAPQFDRAALPAVIGAAAAALATTFGAGAWMPPIWLSGVLCAVVLASLAEAGRHRGGAREPESQGCSGWTALPLAATATVLWLALARHMPAYVAPSGNVTAESLLALLLPGLLVALPARVLCAQPGALRRVVLSVGLITLALAAWNLAQSLSLSKFSMQYAQRTWEWRGVAQRWSPWLDEWRTWLLIFGGWSAAGWGLGLGALGRRVAGPALLGVGLGFLAQEWVVRAAPADAQRLLVLAAGCAALGAVWPWHRRAWWLSPLAVCALFLFPQDRRDDWLSIRRVGEMSATYGQRGRLGEALLFGTGTRDNLSPDGREAARRSFTGDRSLLVHPLESAPPVPEFSETEPGQAVQHQGLRLAGLGVHEGVAPLGAEGSLGRMLRGLHRPGPALALGHGAELLAAELWMQEPQRTLAWSTDFPLDTQLVALLLAELGLPPSLASELAALREPELLEALSERPAEGWNLVTLAPERARWPLAGRVFSAESLARVHDSLSESGRCLAYLDTQDLDERALAGRLAAFSEAFAERALAVIVPRELAAPFVLLVGWRAADAAPRVSELLASLRCPQRTGERSIVESAEGLASLIVFSASELTTLAATRPSHRESRPLPPGRGPTGWAALAALAPASPEARPALDDLPAARGSTWQLVRALARVAPTGFDVDRPAGTMSVQVAEDTDWPAFEALIHDLAAVSAQDPSNPLLPVVLAALLEPLVEYSEYGRFASAWEALAADQLPGWRLPQALAQVATAMQENELAAEAAERARAWAASRVISADSEQR
ncbi:MAG: hypothetical protein DHS20C15_18440 [Planctomycetota bacterium]|nr:MAG: hypothetical protein DHS20C15_18440 [Planctomycetota bacterium]